MVSTWVDSESPHLCHCFDSKIEVVKIKKNLRGIFFPTSQTKIVLQSVESLLTSQAANKITNHQPPNHNLNHLVRFWLICSPEGQFWGFWGHFRACRSGFDQVEAKWTNVGGTLDQLWSLLDWFLGLLDQYWCPLEKLRCEMYSVWL